MSVTSSKNNSDINSSILRRESMWVLVIFAIATYLTLINLGEATLWHDEAAIANSGKNIVTTGRYNAWDGRNLFVGNNGAAINKNFQPVAFPPWQALPSALGILFFGDNEFGVRFFHSILGLASLLLFWLLLRLDFANATRVRVLAFTLFALSTQIILFLRYGRYVADSLFFTFLLFYTYRLYIGPNGKLRHLIIAASAAVLGFFNHFAIGGAFILSLAVWHLIYYFKQTSRQQWIEVTIAGLVSAGIILAYLLWAGIIGSDDKLEFTDEEYVYPWFKRHSLLIYYNFRELLRLGWLPWPVAVWFTYFIAIFINKSRNTLPPNARKSRKVKKESIADNNNALHQSLFRWSVLFTLFLFFSGLLALRVVAIHPFADIRYIVPVLAFTSLVIAAFIDWLWRKKNGWIYALTVLVAVTTSNILSYPYMYVRFTLPNLLYEIHAPFNGYLKDTIGYLKENANQDDTIFVDKWQDRGVMLFYLSEQMIFCCSLDDQSYLPEKKIRALNAPIYKGDITTPTWLVLFPATPKVTETKSYELVYTSPHIGFPRHRPELENHSFKPLYSDDVLIYRSKSIK